MKKVRRLTLLALIAIFSLVALFGCNKKEDQISSVSLKDHDPNTAIEIALGGFDCSQYTVAVAYESGKTVEIPLTEEMILETDLIKLYHVGEHDITVRYGEQTYTFKVAVKRATFADLSFPENNVFTYNGKAHTVELNGNIPANAVVTYLGGNSFVNAGTYDVTAVVSCEGYVTEKLTTTVTIKRATYDMSGVKFEGREVVYDGNLHTLAISGVLPEGVSSPTYTIKEKIASGASDVGEYKVKATFVNHDPNYEAIPAMEATLKITPAEYKVKDVDIVFKSEDGKVIGDAVKIYDGKSITFDLDDYSKLSKKVSVAFSVCDKDGKVISTSNQSTGIVNTGVYTVKAEFVLTDGKNYQTPEPLVRTFEVLKAEHPQIENVQLLSAQATYDEKEHSILLEGELPKGVTVSYEYYLNGTLVVGADGKPVQSVVDAGIYVVKAVFAHKNENFGKIPDLLAKLYIKKSIVSFNSVGFFGESTVEYSGKFYGPTFTTWKDANKTDYDILQYGSVKYYMLDHESGTYQPMGEKELPIEPGTYRVTLDVSIAEEQKQKYDFEGDDDVQTFVKQFEILKKTVARPNVTFTSEPVRDYTEDAKEVAYTYTADEALTTVSKAYFKNEAGTYVAMEEDRIPGDKGVYKLVVTVAVSDPTRYVFPNELSEMDFTFEFEILPAKIDLSGLTFNATEFTYNGSNQHPSLNEIPKNVLMTLKLYESEGTQTIEQALDAGEYRCEVTFLPKNANYVIVSGDKLTADFEILPAEIDVSGLVFDQLAFTYDGAKHYPSLVGVPENVLVATHLYWGDDENNNSDIYGDKVLALDIGLYGCRVTLKAINENYVLVGDHIYRTAFQITRVVIDITEIVTREIVLTYQEDGYEDAYLQKLIVDGVGYAVVCSGMGSYYKLDEAGGEQLHGGYLKDAQPGRYVSKGVILDAENNYILKYNGEEKVRFVVNIYFTVVSAEQP